jgi:ALG6, ALG8 glycosyltransferase family
MDKTTAESRSAARWIVVALALATLLKLWLALKTEGSLDIPGFLDQLEKTRQFGAASYSLVGKWGNPLNVLPLPLYLVRAAEFLSVQTGIHFAFWIRLPSIFADIGSVCVVWKLMERSTELRIRSASVLLMTLSPISILISGFHGNFDPLMIFLVLLSVYVISIERSIVLAGIVFGLALSIKVVPLLFAPAVFFYLRGFRTRTIYFCAAAVTFMVGMIPYGWQNPSGLYHSVFEHAGLYANWGWSTLVAKWVRQPFVNGFHPVGVHSVIAAVAKYALITVIVALSFVMNRKRPTPPLFLQLGVISLAFMSLTPGFGDQYLSWLVPWVVALGLAPTIVSYLAGGIFLLNSYFCPFADCVKSREYLDVICWVFIVWVFLVYCAYSVLSGNSPRLKSEVLDQVRSEIEE